MKNKDNTTYIPPTSEFLDPNAADKKAQGEKEKSVKKKTGLPLVRKKAEAPTKADVGTERTANESKPAEVQKKAEKKAAAPAKPIRKTESAKKGSKPADKPLDPSVPAQESATTRRKHSLFQWKNTHDKQDTPDDGLSPMEQITKRTGLTEDDVQMMIELGYERELGRQVGFDLLKNLKKERLQTNEETDAFYYRTAFGYRGKESVANNNRQAALAAYVRDRAFLIVRLVITALCTLLLFFIDQPSFLSDEVLKNVFANDTQKVHIVGLALLAAVLIVSHKQINAGIRSFFKFLPTPYSVPAMLTPIVVLYSVLTFIFAPSMMQFRFLLALVFLLIALCDLLRLNCELNALRLLTTDVPKTVLTEATPRKIKVMNNQKIVKIINDDLGKNIYEVGSANQILGFFRRFNYMTSAARPFAILISCTMAFAVLLGFVGAVCTHSLSSVFSIFMTTLLLTAPISACFAYFYPLCRANRILAHRSCTVVGEESVQELSSEKTVIFSDTALYHAKKCTEIALRESDDFRPDLQLAGALFRTLGGTLAGVARKHPSLHAEPQLSILRVQDFGTEAVTEDKRHIFLGNADFIRQNGIRLSREAADREASCGASVGVLYFAVNKTLKLSFEIEYETDPSFEELIANLAEGNTAVAITSYNPTLNDAFVQKSREGMLDPVTVIKSRRFDEDKTTELVDTGIVALGPESDVVYPLYALKGISSLRRFGMRIQLISSILGFIGILALTVFNPTAPLGIPAVLIYQAFWTLLFVLSTHAELNEIRLRLNE